jgi:hypothetical protein
MRKEQSAAGAKTRSQPTSTRKSGNARMGALPPRYSFALNRYTGVRFTTCPGCEAKTRVRKIPLVVHIDGHGLLLLRKTCRLCVSCDLLLVHQDEIEPLIARSVDRGTEHPSEYLILGTVEPRAWRRGLSGGVTIDDLVQHMSDFKAHMQIGYTPGGWSRSE